MAKTDFTGRVARWKVILSNYDLTVKTQPGAKNGNADRMSRLMSTSCAGDEEDVDDELPESWTQ
ncbi:hypothetical protein BGZ73_001476, partial [Actinomortierella ambigua]